MELLDYINSRLSSKNLLGEFNYTVNLVASYLQFANNILEASSDPRQLDRASQAVKYAAEELVKFGASLDKLVEETPEKLSS